jgi:hypothetical protein
MYIVPLKGLGLSEIVILGNLVITHTAWFEAGQTKQPTSCLYKNTNPDTHTHVLSVGLRFVQVDLNYGTVFSLDVTHPASTRQPCFQSHSRSHPKVG